MRSVRRFCGALSRSVGRLRNMGFNADNVFVNITDQNAVLGAVSHTFKDKKWKVAISKPLDRWVQIIESHEETPPEFALQLSANLKCVAVCAQLYETAGEVAWFVYDNGIETEAVHKDATDDPGEEIRRVLLQRKVPFQMRLFREVIGQQQGWSIEQSRS